jgi:hypothetical protein
MCNPVAAVTFAPVYTLFTPPAYGVLLGVVDVNTLVVGNSFSEVKYLMMAYWGRNML